MGDGPVAMAAKVAETAEELRGCAHAIPGGGLAASWYLYVLADDEQSSILMVDSQTETGRVVWWERESNKQRKMWCWWWAEVWKSCPHLSKSVVQVLRKGGSSQQFPRASQPTTSCSTEA